MTWMFLTTPGKISHKQMEQKVREQYSRFDTQRKFADAAEEDRKELEELKALEEKIKKKK